MASTQITFHVEEMYPGETVVVDHADDEVVTVLGYDTDNSKAKVYYSVTGPEDHSHYEDEDGNDVTRPRRRTRRPYSSWSAEKGCNVIQAGARA